MRFRTPASVTLALCTGIAAVFCIAWSYAPELNAQTVGPANLAQAQTAAATSSADISAQIAQLEADIAKLQAQLDTTTSQKQTLQNAIAALNLNIQKLQKNIALTSAQITQSDTQISQLTTTIATTSVQITQMQGEVEDSLQQLNMLDQEPTILLLLSGGTLSTFFDQSATLASLRTDLENKITELAALTTTLQKSKAAQQQKRVQLSVFQQNLSEQKTGLAITRDSQTQLLQQTKDKESTYQAQIAQKKAQEAESEQELLNNGTNLNGTLQNVPPAGSGVLSWPLMHTSITQYFGNTPFATQNPSVYNGHGHDGIDLAASPGTPVMAARAGVVVGTGNTDLTCPGASFGKWVFIQHDDGLSTMYAHLSTILVTTGQQVTTGQLVAYSDTTGYAIGPHLHFGVYATQGSKIESWPTTNPRPECKGKIYTMPVATLAAYLNPLSYLPPLPK